MMTKKFEERTPNVWQNEKNRIPVCSCHWEVDDAFTHKEIVTEFSKNQSRDWQCSWGSSGRMLDQPTGTTIRFGWFYPTTGDEQ
jgi:hypothetical protein